MSTHLKLALLLLAVGACLAVTASEGELPVAAQETYSISGRVINDLDGNGTADPGEPGVEGWRVVLTRLFSMSPGSVVVAEARTGPSGAYLLSDVRQGMYQIDLPCNGQPAAQWTGTFLDKRAGRAFYIGPPDAESIVGMDFIIGGLAKPLRTDGEITGRLVNDLDIDGVADRREPGLAGWTVTMIRESPPLVCVGKLLPRESFRVTTDSRGIFRATELPEGVYQVGGGMNIFPPRDGQTSVKHWAVTAPVQTHPEWEAGDIPLSDPVDVPLTKGKMRADVDDTLITLLNGSGSISGAAFRDLNGNLTRDENEPPAYPLLTELMYVGDRSLLLVYPISFQRLPEGRYKFEGLTAGQYVVSALVSMGDPIHPEAFYLGPFDIGEGEAVADLPIPPLPPTPTPVPRPTPVPPVDLHAPLTGSGGASSDSGLADLAVALTIAGALAVSGALVLHRRRSRARAKNPSAC